MFYCRNMNVFDYNTALEPTHGVDGVIWDKQHTHFIIIQRFENI